VFKASAVHLLPAATAPLDTPTEPRL